MPPELREWTDNTLLGVFAGVSYGGIRHYLHTRHEGGSGSPILMPCQNHQHAAWMQSHSRDASLALCDLDVLRSAVQVDTDRQTQGCPKRR